MRQKEQASGGVDESFHAPSTDATPCGQSHARRVGGSADSLVRTVGDATRNNMKPDEEWAGLAAISDRGYSNPSHPR